MPLPPRDLTAMHLTLNPILAEMHAYYPLSRFLPVVAAFRLHTLACQGTPLLRKLDDHSWLLLACLDDHAADYCIAHATRALWNGLDKSALNHEVHRIATALVALASPPMAPAVRAQPPAQTRAAPTTVPSASSASSASKKAEASPPPPPPSPATSHTSGSTAAQVPPAAPFPRPISLTKGFEDRGLHEAVARLMLTAVLKYPQKIDFVTMHEHVPGLLRLSASQGCQALTEFMRKMRAPAPEASHSKEDCSKLLGAIVASMATGPVAKK